jgi:hypothetical protein
MGLAMPHTQLQHRSASGGQANRERHLRNRVR